MYGEEPKKDILRFIHAFASDQLAWLMPRTYVRLTAQTGRGSNEESSQEIADYFRLSFYEYFDKLGIEKNDIKAFLKDKRVLEYGPGDLPGVSLLMYAHGAGQVVCVDRFPLVSASEKNVQVLANLIDELEDELKTRALACFKNKGQLTSGFNNDCINYLIRPSGLSGLENDIDLIFSRAVLEHVDDLSATFNDMLRALQCGGIAIHKVDLKSHGLHKRNSLDFLTWPPLLWKLMYAHKGVPNRWRVDRYRSVIAETGLQTQLLEACEVADKADVEEVYPELTDIFQGISKQDLAWLSFWLILKKPAN